VKYACSLFQKNIKEFPGICSNWDNSPRRKKKSFWAFKNSTPKEYGQWLKFLLDNFKPYSAEENFIFINAWNEWDLAYLEETKKQIHNNP